tara:strand:+ start:712 stop:1866 length:1155 start_codon:yes stop_codon:yes gene_type:complete
MAGVPKLRNASTAGYYDGTVNSVGQPHGRGLAEFDDGTRYEGDFWDGEVDGLAIGSAPHGGTFEGRFERGQLHGLAKYVWSNGKVYRGQWVHGKRSGAGECVDAAGVRYSGEWRDDKPHGQGTYTWPCGTRHTGAFVAGKPEGWGVRIDTKEHVTEVGVWKEGERDGHIHARKRSSDGTLCMVLQACWAKGVLVNADADHTLYVLGPQGERRCTITTKLNRNARLHGDSVVTLATSRRRCAVEWDNGRLAGGTGRPRKMPRAMPPPPRPQAVHPTPVVATVANVAQPVARPVVATGAAVSEAEHAALRRDRDHLWREHEALRNEEHAVRTERNRLELEVRALRAACPQETTSRAQAAVELTLGLRPPAPPTNDGAKRPRCFVGP